MVLKRNPPLASGINGGSLAESSGSCFCWNNGGPLAEFPTILSIGVMVDLKRNSPAILCWTNGGPLAEFQLLILTVGPVMVFQWNFPPIDQLIPAN